MMHQEITVDCVMTNRDKKIVIVVDDRKIMQLYQHNNMERNRRHKLVIELMENLTYSIGRVHIRSIGLIFHLVVLQISLPF
mgnify:CR=1 FL=1